MNALLIRMTAWFEKLPDRLATRRWLAWLLFFVIAGSVIAGIGRMRSDLSTEGFFAPDDPVRVAYNRFRAAFGSDETLVLVYRAKDGDIFSDKSLATLSELHYELEEAVTRSDDPIPRLTQIRSLINADYMEAEGDTLLSRDFIGKNLPTTAEQRETVRQRALAHRVYPGRFLSEDSEYGAIMLRTDFNARIVSSAERGTEVEPAATASLDDEEEEFDADARANASDVAEVEYDRSDMPEYEGTVAAVNAILKKPQYSGTLEFHMVGNPALMAWAYKAMSEEMGFVMVGMLVLLTLTLLFLFRSLSAVVWPISIVAVSLLSTTGLMGWVGYPSNNFLQIIVFLVLAVGVADSLHILSGYIYFRGKEQDHRQALRSTFKKSGVACFLTTLTTSIGLLALSFVPATPVRQFGQTAAFGVWTAFAMTIFVLPLMLDLWSPRGKKPTKTPRAHLVQRLLARIEGVATAHPKLTIGVALAIVIVCGFGARDVIVDSNLIENIDESEPIRQAVELVDAKMAGSSNMEVLIDTGEPDGFKDPKVLGAVDAFQKHLETAYPGIVTKAVSLTNVLKESYQAVNESQEAFYRVPESRAVLSQVIFLFESANTKDRRLLVTDDYRAARVSITLKNVSTRHGMRIFDSINEYLADVIKPLRSRHPDLKTTLTGQLPMSITVSEYVNDAQLKTFGFAFVAILLLLPFVLGSPRIGVIAMIPNIIPAVVIFGIMGFAGIFLDVHTLLIAPIIIGIAVDDTIHFMTHFRLEMELHGDVHRAIRNTFREVGQAIVFTSVVLSAGFLVFMHSSDRGLAAFGMLSAVGMAVALACDLFLLPALLGGAARRQEIPPDARVEGESV